MSLINEALRRTRDAAYDNAARPPTSPGADYQLKPPAKVPSSGLGRTRLVLTVLISLLFLGGLTYATYQFAHVFPRARLDYMPAATTPPQFGPAGPPAAAPVAPVETPMPTPPTPPATVPPVEQVAVVPAPPAALPALKVTGFSVVGGIRDVMINGRVLRVGDSIHGAKILAIDKPVVRLLFDGRELELTPTDSPSSGD